MISGFTKNTLTKPGKGIFINVVGLPGVGKTNFGLTAPGPIAVQNMDVGLDKLLYKFKDKDLAYKNYRLPFEHKQLNKVISRKQEDRLPMALDMDAVIDLWEEYKRDFVALLRDPNVNTILQDSITDSWELIRGARFGKLDQVLPTNYGPVNLEYSYLYKLALESDKVLITTQKLKKEYRGEKGKESWTGGYEPSGYSGFGFLVEINIRAYREYDEDAGTKVFKMEITKCKPNPTLETLTLVNDMCNFDTIMQFLG